MLPSRFAGGRRGRQEPRVPRVPGGNPADRGGRADDAGSRGAQVGNGDREGPYQIAALRAMGALALVFLCAVAALWVLVFRDSAWQALLFLPLGGFLGSWIAALWGVLAAGRRREDAATEAVPRYAAALARYGLLLGAFGFVAFFLAAYR